MQTTKSNALESWLYQVKISKSGSENTEERYRKNMERFCYDAEKTANQIVEDYDTLPEKTFKRLYAQAIITHLAKLDSYVHSSNSRATVLNSIRSFFKYHSLPLNFIPAIRVEIENHNRDIQHKEIVEILREAEPRERALYSLIAQTGLRPDTLTKLKICNIEGIEKEQTQPPYLITVEKAETKGKYCEYFTFSSKEGINYLKEYLKTRKQPITPDSYVFAMYGDESQPVSPGIFSHLFRRTVMKLQENNVLSFKTKRKQLTVEGKDHKVLRRSVTRNELRLYNLRKFFRKYAGQAGPDYVNFWMGHTSVLGVDLHYFSRDIEQHRQIYKEKAMPYLRLETRTPDQNETQIEKLSTENQELRDRLAKMEEKIKVLDLATVKKLDDWLENVVKMQTEEYVKRYGKKGGLAVSIDAFLDALINRKKQIAEEEKQKEK